MDSTLKLNPDLSRNYSRDAYWVIVFVLVVGLFVSPASNPIAWDIFGYYLYLPLTFIYNDLGLMDISVVENIVSTYKSTATLYQINKSPEQLWVLKYTSGMAIMYAPFFFISHILALITGQTA